MPHMYKYLWAFFAYGLVDLSLTKRYILESSFRVNSGCRPTKPLCYITDWGETGDVERQYKLQFLLQHSEDEYFATALADVQQSVVVVETQTRRAAQLVVGVEQFLSVVEVDAEHLDAVIARVCNPDAIHGVDDKGPRLVELVEVSATRRAVAVCHLLELAVNQTHAVRRRLSRTAVTDDPDTLVERHGTPWVVDRLRQVDTMNEFASRAVLAESMFLRVAHENVVIPRQRQTARLTVCWPRPTQHVIEGVSWVDSRIVNIQDASSRTC